MNPVKMTHRCELHCPFSFSVDLNFFQYKKHLNKKKKKKKNLCSDEQSLGDIDGFFFNYMSILELETD